MNIYLQVKQPTFVLSEAGGRRGFRYDLRGEVVIFGKSCAQNYMFTPRTSKLRVVAKLHDVADLKADCSHVLRRRKSESPFSQFGRSTLSALLWKLRSCYLVNE